MRCRGGRGDQHGPAVVDEEALARLALVGDPDVGPGGGQLPQVGGGRRVGEGRVPDHVADADAAGQTAQVQRAGAGDVLQGEPRVGLHGEDLLAGEERQVLDAAADRRQPLDLLDALWGGGPRPCSARSPSTTCRERVTRRRSWCSSCSRRSVRRDTACSGSAGTTRPSGPVGSSRPSSRRRSSARAASLSARSAVRSSRCTSSAEVPGLRRKCRYSSSSVAESPKTAISLSPTLCPRLRHGPTALSGDCPGTCRDGRGFSAQSKRSRATPGWGRCELCAKSEPTVPGSA